MVSEKIFQCSDIELSMLKQYRLIFHPIMQVAPLLDQTSITQFQGLLKNNISEFCYAVLEKKIFKGSHKFKMTKLS